MAVGRGRHSDRPGPGAGPGGFPGDEEGEAAAGGEGGRQQGETPVHCDRQRQQRQGLDAARRPPGAEGPSQPGEREERAEEEEKSKGGREEEEEGAAGGGRHPNAVSEARLEDGQERMFCL